MVKLRLAWWIMAKWGHQPRTFEDIFRFPNLVSVSDISKNNDLVQVTWQTPEFGAMKFDVDGSSKGKPGHVGIGGVLKDHNGHTKAKFSKSIGIVDSNETELLAIKEAFLIFGASRWCSSHNLIIDTDSSNAMKWTLQPNSTPWKLKKISLQIEALKKKIACWKVQKVPRMGNSEADLLAKAGVQRERDLFVVL